MNFHQKTWLKATVSERVGKDYSTQELIVKLTIGSFYVESVAAQHFPYAIISKSTVNGGKITV